ncbi:uncharacterized protein LOC134448566 [Engraulis encrasicolus]|uniref:uncharacterized protein LOC134448566 n=1 Tax=Engraulis encrasicolus TaxID=184585 RepID=UPI002FD09103
MVLLYFPGPRLAHFLGTALLVYLNLSWSLQDSTYTYKPENITSASGDSATFKCGISSSSSSSSSSSLLVFSIQGNNNITMSCPGNVSESWTIEALKWSCSVTDGKVLAVWTVTGTSLPDNGTVFRCQVEGQPDAVGYLWVYVSSSYFGVLIGCVIGGFFGILIVFGLIWIFLQKSESFRECFGGKQEEDECTIVEDSKGH